MNLWCLQVFSDRMNEIADRLYKPFSERLGLSSIREYEEQHQEFEARTEAEKARLSAQVRVCVCVFVCEREIEFEE